MTARARDHAAEYQRARQRAIELGFESPRERRRAPRTIRSRRDIESLPPRAVEVREAALRAVSIMRQDKLDLATAARLAGTTPTAVDFYAGRAFDDAGRLKAADRMLRPMRIYSDGESVVVDVRGSRVASTIGEYHNAVRAYLNQGDVTGLARFEGQRVAGRPLETDPDVIDEMARRGTFRFDAIYVMVA